MTVLDQRDQLSPAAAVTGQHINFERGAQKVEVRLACNALNRMLEFGAARSVAVGALDCIRNQMLAHG